MKEGCLAFALVSLMCSSVVGNVGFFGGSGRTIELSKSEQVQLVSEEVTITPMLGPNADGDQVMYHCQFVLKNLSPTVATAQAGFPLDADLYEGSAFEETEHVLSYHFIVRDDHETYHVRCIHRDPPAKYRELFVWDMTFSPKESKRLRVAYILPMSVAVASTARREKESSENAATRYGRPWYAMLEPCAFEQLTYITETGNSWNGPVENAAFRVHTAGMAYWMHRRSDFYLSAVDPPPGGSGPQRLYRMKVGLTYLQLSPGDWKYDSENGSMTWRSSNYEPGTPIRFSWFGTALPAEAGECESVVRQLMGAHPKPAEVLELSEIVAAFYGITPKTDAVRAFVERQVWYHPKRNLQRSGLTEEQRETLARLKAIAEEGLSASEGDSEKPAQNPGTRTDCGG